MRNNVVSIIVPIYNVEKYVSKCLESLINQTYKNIEVLAIIDGSPDDSVSIVKQYAKKDDRIKCIEKENGGYGSVLQKAISMIKTEFFLICDPDDWLAENAVEVLLKAATENNVDLVVGDKYLVYSNNYEKRYCSSVNKVMNIIPNKIYKEDIGKFSLMQVSPHSKLFKTSLVKDIVFPERVSYTDYLLYIVAVNNSKSGIYINKALSYYLIDREGNTTTDVSLKAINSVTTVFTETINYLKNKKCINNDIYYSLYNEYRYVILEQVSKLDRDSYFKMTKKIKECLFLLKNKHKEIIKRIEFDNIIKTFYNKIICYLMFKNLTNDIVTRIIIKFLKKRK